MLTHDLAKVRELAARPEFCDHVTELELRHDIAELAAESIDLVTAARGRTLLADEQRRFDRLTEHLKLAEDVANRRENHARAVASARVAAGLGEAGNPVAALPK